MFEKLAAKVKTKYRTDKTKLEKKILNVTDFVKKAKLNELENKIPDVISLATKTALTAVENKIPDVGSFVKKKKTMTQKLVSLKRNLLILIMTSILLLQNLIL